MVELLINEKIKRGCIINILWQLGRLKIYVSYILYKEKSYEYFRHIIENERHSSLLQQQPPKKKTV